MSRNIPIGHTPRELDEMFRSPGNANVQIVMILSEIFNKMLDIEKILKPEKIEVVTPSPVKSDQKPSRGRPLRR